MKEWLWLYFVVGAFLSWGCYVPTLHEGQKLLGEGKPGAGALRAFLCVGVAYFVSAVIVPGVLLMMGHESTKFDARGTTFAFFGGVLGAAGALCIIFSIRYGGDPMWVAPLVFAGAPIINALVTLVWHPPKIMPGVPFYIGLIMASVGCGLVLFEKGNVEAKSRALKSPSTADAAEPAAH